MPHPRKIFLYMYGTARPGASGAELRFYSVCRAYQDLGFTVELIQFELEGEPFPTQPELPVKNTVIKVPVFSPSLSQRLVYRSGYPSSAGAVYIFPRHRAVLREAQLRANQFPNVLHQFENTCESAIPFLRGVPAIWDCHDLPHRVREVSQIIDQRIEGRPTSRSEAREIRFHKNLERRVAKSSDLILTVSETERDEIRAWGCTAVECLPLSLPHAPRELKKRHWVDEGRLRILHVGALAHAPTFYSLTFLLGNVFPRLPAKVLEAISLDVVGNVAKGERSRRILELSAGFSNVRIHGRVPDLQPFFDGADLQAVAATESHGLRTRIVESFAFGVPVLSTRNAYLGAPGGRPGENLLEANSVEEWVSVLQSLLRDPGVLAELARQGRATYDNLYSPPKVAATLAEYLEKHLGM